MRRGAKLPKAVSVRDTVWITGTTPSLGFLVFCCIAYYAWFFVGYFSDKDTVEPVLVESPQTISVDIEKASHTVPVTAHTFKAGQDVASYADVVGLPFKASIIYLSGVNTVYSDNRFVLYRQYFFDLVVGDKTFSINGDDLSSLGFNIDYQSDCLVHVKSSKTHFYATCPPKESRDYVEDKNTTEPVLAGLI